MMKLIDITSAGPELSARPELLNAIDREETHPEIVDLQKARGAELAACDLLSYDERVLADSILAMLDSDSAFIPSENVLAFVRTVLEKMSLCRKSRGWIT